MSSVAGKGRPDRHFLSDCHQLDSLGYDEEGDSAKLEGVRSFFFSFL